MKKTELGEGSKANHLSYLGDATIGTGVNIGAGTITCNYDGYKKFQTVVGDGVFIGSDVQLVAPVTVGQGSIIAAGATVTQDVPKDALGDCPGSPGDSRGLGGPAARVTERAGAASGSIGEARTRDAAS